MNSEDISLEIDAAIKKWDGETFIELAKRLNVPRSVVLNRYEVKFAEPARQMIAAGSTNSEITAAIGLPTTAIAGFRAALSRRKTEEIVEITEATEVKLGLERNLQEALRGKIAQLEAGLTIADNGSEKTIETGRIDILATDKDGRDVVIELKLGRADKSAIGQILGYMGELSETSGKISRGILVAEEFDIKAIYAAKLVSQLQLMEYKLNFSFQKPS